MDLNGQTIGQYQIVERIGSGGMATVYKAYQPGLDRYVAIKVLPAQHALTPGFKERFINEAKVVAKLDHPNILPIYDAGFEGDLSYYVMKYVPGQRTTLRDLLTNPLSLTTVVQYLDQIASALDHAHDRGIVHRDIKPTNILHEDDWLLLADFGLAKIVMDNKQLTGTGAIIGTPAYLSPEQAEGKPIDHRADIYSLGVVLYQMLVGEVPFDAESPMGVMVKHIYEPAPSPRELNADLPAEVEGVILQALAKDPSERFNRAGELARALRSAVNFSSVITSSAGPVKPARLFICYKRNVEPDQSLAFKLYETLSQQGHDVFIDQTLRTGDAWLAEIDQQIKESDFLIVLLSQNSAESEMVQAEIRRAYEYRKIHGKPWALPVRVGYEGLLPYSIDAFLDPLQYVIWRSDADTERVFREISGALAGGLRSRTPLPVRPGSNILSEDGRAMTDEDDLPPPLPEFDPRLLESLEAPGGVVKLRDKFYIQRQADLQLRREVVKAGTTTTIRAPRQTGKSSLLVRGANHARQHGARVVHLDFQRLDMERLTVPDLFLRDLAEFIVRKLRLDLAEVDNFWRGSLGPQDKLTYLLEDYVLPETDAPIVLALDEVDRLLQTSFHTDFFALLRSWHNSRALEEQWDRFNMIMVISTEPYLLIDDVNQSPFNVGLKIYLEDFNEDQVRDLNQRHGWPVFETDFPDLFKLLAGQPYLTRKALYTLAIEHLSWQELMETVALDHGPFGDHLRGKHWLLRNEPDLRQALKQIIEHGTSDNELAVFRLLQAGLVKGSGDDHTCRCDLYRMYFEEKLA